MSFNILTPRKSINKSFLKVKPNRSEIELFKLNLIHLITQINEKESEEFHKNIISRFLENTYYGRTHYINTKGRNDLVIHNGKDAKTPVGVIIEAKKPSNKSEMPQKENLNVKAFQELVLYYLRERIKNGNTEIHYLVITNIYEWFIFDVEIFEKGFAQNKTLVKKFQDFEDKRLASTSTDFFYKEIAKPAIDELLSGTSKVGKEITFTHFNFTDYEAIIINKIISDDNKLIALFKVLSPQHLLKLPFKNDSNTLNKGFYTELLHIIGLSEIKDGSLKFIDRKEEGKRDTGSILENTITQLRALDKIARLKNPSIFGESEKDRYFNVALELVITWVNRILFLKLLEAQLTAYHRGDKSYKFLDKGTIRNFDDLNTLFFQVLARKKEEREVSVQEAFYKIPYLNSSLFEPTELEHMCLFISQLHSDITLPISSSTVLKDGTGRKSNGNLDTLEYLFCFLDAYDFSNEGSEEIQEENKTLVSASVLGLIFEKINGYKDGSYFTPGFITMYMCRQTIRKAIIQKFNDIKKWDCKSIDDLYEKIENKQEANEIINSLKICDPAVGSGHFLVSALNEIIALKSDLRILTDRHGRTLRDYYVDITNDELIITDENGNFFEYNPKNRESQRVQEAIFHEKEVLIENCLFGVDINPNSVKICRLRLWIELLKNSYYKKESPEDLETLPNIDINIKCGNSIISRFPLDVDIGQALKKTGITIKKYREAIHNYHHSTSKSQKREIEGLIAKIKGEFRTEISNNDPKIKRLNIKRGERDNILNQHQLFELTKEEKKQRKELLSKLKSEIDKLESDVSEIKSNILYEGAFEWRFEFPEVLSENGEYLGFEVVIANPPYGVEFKNNEKEFFKNSFPISSAGKIDSYKLFYELSFRILKKDYFQAFIAPNTFLYNIQSKTLREFILEETTIEDAVELRKNIFEDAPDVVTVMLLLKFNHNNSYEFPIKVAYPDYKYTDIQNGKWQIDQSVPISTFLKDSEKKINLRRDFRLDSIIIKMNSYQRLEENFYLKQGTKPYGDKEKKKAKLLAQIKADSSWEPAINGRNISPYHISFENEFVKRSKELHSCLDREIIESPKIYFQRMRKISLFPRIVAAYDENNIHGLYTCSVIYPRENVSIPLKYILALLNSHLVNIWYKNYDTDIEIKLASVKKIPIPDINVGEAIKFINLVNEIISIKNGTTEDNLQQLSDELDELVYDLFGLKEDEKALVRVS